MARRIELTTFRYLRNLIHVSVLGAAGALVAAPAAGNGRFPTAQHLVEHPRDPQKLMLRTTFGLLLSKDTGKSWRWVCEQAVGFRDNEDPPVDITGSGALLVGVFGGLSVSRDFGCEWTSPPEIQGKNVKDVSVQPDDPSKAVLVVSNGSANLIFTNQVYKTVDDGVTWTKLGPDLPTDLVTHTLDVAPSNPSRVYVTASLYSPDGGADTGRLLQLSAAGDAWEAVTIPGMGEPYLSGIDPTDDELVYVRMNGLESDQLIVSRDAGVSWTQAMSVGGTPGMLGFALSPDGSTVLVGDDPTGIYRAPSSSLVFEPVSDFRNQCLTWTPTALYACSSYFLNGEFLEKGFLLARSDDVGKSFTPLWHRLPDVLGPVECGAETTTAKRCTTRWADVQCNTLGNCPTRDAGRASDGGPVAASNGGGSENCGCRFVGPGRATLLALIASLALLARARRRSEV